MYRCGRGKAIPKIRAEVCVYCIPDFPPVGKALIRTRRSSVPGVGAAEISPLSLAGRGFVLCARGDQRNPLKAVGAGGFDQSPAALQLPQRRTAIDEIDGAAPTVAKFGDLAASGQQRRQDHPHENENQNPRHSPVFTPVDCQRPDSNGSYGKLPLESCPNSIAW